MGGEHGPTIRLKRMGIELRRIRSAAGLSLSGAARHLSRSPASLSKIENGYTQLYDRDLDLILDRYEITDETYRQRLHHLNINGRKKGWWTEYYDVADPAALEYVALEAETTSIWEYESTLIPGLLQTEDYARAVIVGASTHGPDWDAEVFVRLRMSRQRILTSGNPPAYAVVIGEAALRQLIGGREVMRDQLELLVDLAEAENVDLRVLPFAVGAHPGINGSFRILDVPPGLKVASVDHSLGSVHTDEDDEVQRRMVVFDRLQELALSPAETCELLRQAAAEL